MKTSPEKELSDSFVASCSINFSQDEGKIFDEVFNQTKHSADDLSNMEKKDSFMEKPKKKRYKLAIAAIFAVFVLQFVWQFSFIQNEKLRNVEKTLNEIQLEELPSKIITKLPSKIIKAEKPVEVETVYVEKKAEIISPSKDVMPIVYRQPESKKVQPENKPIQPEIKKKSSRETKDERLRRAEKLLTGF